jgi:uncharacterized C2H2 Zn-finger protein|tara:strand:+ start:388 stop:558 length:171 start_codon:yes stop_codon:yes gene_type:complete
MHHYQCPYCKPSKDTGKLEWYEDQDGEDTMYCPCCEEFFAATEDFLSEQKRKIKDG